MKKQMMEDSSYSKYGRKRQRLLDSEDDEGQLNEQGVLSLGRDMKGFDDWNKAKKDFNTLIQTIMLRACVDSAHTNQYFFSCGDASLF